MFFQLSLSVLLVTICQVSHGQVPFLDLCPEVKVVEEFDAKSYMGTWFEHSKYPFVFEVGKKCMYADYGLIDDTTIKVMNAAVNRLTGRDSNVTGTAKVLGPGRLSVAFPNSGNTKQDRANYLVLGTDYNSYVVVYSCTNLSSLAHTKIVWILTRKRKPSKETVEAAYKIMDDNNLTKVFLMDTIQDNCPEPNGPGESTTTTEPSTISTFTTDGDEITTTNVIGKA